MRCAQVCGGGGRGTCAWVGMGVVCTILLLSAHPGGGACGCFHIPS